MFYKKDRLFIHGDYLVEHRLEIWTQVSCLTLFIFVGKYKKLEEEDERWRVGGEICETEDTFLGGVS